MADRQLPGFNLGPCQASMIKLFSSKKLHLDASQGPKYYVTLLILIQTVTITVHRTKNEVLH